MEKTNFETAMREKLVECDAWINDKDAAIERLAEAEKAYEEAKAVVAEYTPDNIIAVENYRAEVQAQLDKLTAPEVAVAPEEMPVEPSTFQSEEQEGPCYFRVLQRLLPFACLRDNRRAIRRGRGVDNNDSSG